MNEILAIAIFCLVDDTLKIYHRKQLKNPKLEIMSDSEVVFTGILSAQLFAGNLRKGLAYVLERKFCHKGISESRFLKRLKAIPEDIWGIIQKIFAKKAGAYDKEEYIIDSFPCPLCHNIRIPRCRIAQGHEFRGYNASKKQYFYGLKVYAIVGVNGIPISFEYTPGSIHDLTAFRMMDMHAIDGGILYADAAYNDYKLEDQLAAAGLKMVVDRRKTPKDRC